MDHALASIAGQILGPGRTQVQVLRLSGTSRPHYGRRLETRLVCDCWLGDLRAVLAADALLGWREPPDADGESLERLHIAVAELFKAVSNALLDERESAEECIRR